jgi:hypothetical protein
MIGSGTPSSQSNAPLPKPMVCLPLSVIYRTPKLHGCSVCCSKNGGLELGV